MAHLAEPTFRHRLAYARWIHAFRTGDSPTNADIARAAGRSNAWATSVVTADRPPDSREVGRGLAAYLGVDEAWLMDGAGDPPEPGLWDRWWSERLEQARVLARGAKRAGEATKPRSDRGRDEKLTADKYSPPAKKKKA